MKLQLSACAFLATFSLAEPIRKFAFVLLLFLLQSTYRRSTLAINGATSRASEFAIVCDPDVAGSNCYRGFGYLCDAKSGNLLYTGKRMKFCDDSCSCVMTGSPYTHIHTKSKPAEIAMLPPLEREASTDVRDDLDLTLNKRAEDGPAEILWPTVFARGIDGGGDPGDPGVTLAKKENEGPAEILWPTVFARGEDARDEKPTEGPAEILWPTVFARGVDARKDLEVTVTKKADQGPAEILWPTVFARSP